MCTPTLARRCAFRVVVSVASLCQLISASAPLAGQTAAPLPGREPVRSAHAMVVTIHHAATDAGVEILRAGGNAVDAAVAVGFALAVVHPIAGNIGGGGFMLIRPASSSFAGGRPHFLDYREKAPAAASRDMYLDAHGNVVPQLSTVGAKSTGVPGTVAGLAYAERHFGRLGLARVMQPAIRLARDGFTLSDDEAQTLHSDRLARFPESRRVFQRDGDYFRVGEVFRQPDLARTLERIAANPDDFYHGRLAAEIAAFEAATHGMITAADLAAYEVKERTPLVGRYRGLEVLTAPPPSSGGIVLIEALNVLSGYDLPGLGPDRSPAQVHILAEAFRRSYMDRADFLGDPDFNPHLPLAQMANPAYAAAWRRSIDPVKPTPSAALQRPAGFMPEPPAASGLPARESHNTTHFSIVDADGNAVASTYTLNFGFGSGITVGGLGFLLNDEMDDFASKPGTPNGFGLVQSAANAIAPGKRPLSSMTPTIVSEPPACHTVHAPHGTRIGIPAPCTPGKLRLVLGTPGGSTITTTVINDLVSVVDNGLNIQQAADAPRFHHQYLPDTLQFEKAFPEATVEALAAAGYQTERAGAKDEHSPGTWGDSELIARDPKTGELTGGQDSRHHFGKAAGY